MKKLISTLLVVVVLFNFILGSGAVYATKITAPKVTSGSAADAHEGMEGHENILLNEGKSSLGDLPWNLINFGAIAGILGLIINIFPALIQIGMSIIINDTFTIEKVVFNQIKLLDINYFNISDSTGIVKNLRNSVAKYYYILRLVAMALSLVILIYIGIRMALSTIADDKAKYKKMLMGWAESLVLLFLMHYIISIILSFGSTFSNILLKAKNVLDSNGEMSFESDILKTIIPFLGTTSGWNYLSYAIMYWFLIFIQTKFFLSYLKRLITVGFLILISPIVTITYPIDKAGDGKAQAFTVWASEFAINVFIQPIHAFIYLIFMYTAGEIAQYSKLIALLFLLSLTKVEKIILHLFNLRNTVSLRPVDEERKKGKK